jgi:hypothetical protein
MRGYQSRCKEVMMNVLNWLQCRFKVEGAHWPTGDWNMLHEIPHVQSDGNSCGLWTILNAMNVVLKTPYPDNVEDMGVYRAQLAIELHRGKFFIEAQNSEGLDDVNLKKRAAEKQVESKKRRKLTVCCSVSSYLTKSE